MHKLCNYFYNNESKALTFGFSLAFLIRLTLFIFYPDQKFPDSISYEDLGKRFFSNYTYDSDIHMPLYSFLSYLMGGRVNLIFFDIFLSSLTSIYVYKISKIIFSSNSAILAFFIYIFYPYSIFYSLSGLTETIYVFLIIFSFYQLYLKKITTSILVLILSIYLRPTVEVFYPIIIILFLYLHDQMNLKKILRTLSIYFICYFLFLSPWWYHNYLKYDNFVKLNLASGFVLYSGNNPLNSSGGGVAYGNENDDLDISKFNTINDPILKYKAMKDEAIDYIISNPKNSIKMSAIKFKRFWQFYPYTEHYRSFNYIIISVLSYGLIFVFSILSFLFLKKKHYKMLLPIFLFSFVLNLAHIITISSIRYRYPIEPFLIILSSYSVTFIYKYYHDYFNNR